ncbi:terminase [Lelliottia amnigena]|uniref:Terminase n=1 Tax=Lelliottia amnigena TaxID=61646 RepID=A0AAP2AIG7_LELAM|nr:phage terminase small subunit [Lelliottia amnigena]MBL5901176.1 terminase [Lelliottia amnigena]MBL5936982.1 terminase [Lelliottia amnigena]
MGIREYQARVRGAQAIAKGEAPPDSPKSDSLHLQLIALKRDIEAVRSLNNLADRQALKRTELLPRWLPWVEKYLEAGTVYQNPVFVECIIWLFDTESYQKALDYADIAIAQGQHMPARFKSKMPVFVADTMLAWAEKESEHGRGIEPFFTRTFNNVLKNWRLHEEITAKWLKFAALHLLRDDDGRPRASAVESVDVLEQADRWLAQADALYKKIQVRTLRQKIAMRIRALTG